MSLPESGEFAPLARRDGEPLFDEPWQAQALGLAFSLAEAGLFSSAQWSETLGAAHRKHLEGGAPDTPQSYYEAVVQALEQLMREKQPFPVADLQERVETWRRAYLNTPHGQPVLLEAGRKSARKHASD